MHGVMKPFPPQQVQGDMDRDSWGISGGIMRLQGKVAMITGGAHGMGATEAKMFAKEGAKIIVADVIEDEDMQDKASYITGTELVVDGGYLAV
jgi:NAD(P)-dependent dehydrogenase (short-subunit alcohol dehydrogenase family)